MSHCPLKFSRQPSKLSSSDRGTPLLETAPLANPWAPQEEKGKVYSIVGSGLRQPAALGGSRSRAPLGIPVISFSADSSTCGDVQVPKRVNSKIKLSLMQREDTLTDRLTSSHVRRRVVNGLAYRGEVSRGMSP